MSLPGGDELRGDRASPMPGWYPDPYGTLRWWDGNNWGCAAPARRPNTSLAVVSHLGFLAGGFVLPLVIYLAADEDHFAREHARGALNFQITFMVVALGSFFCFFGLTASLGDAAFALFFVVWFGMMALMVLNWVLSIRGALLASRGQPYRYPLAIPFVRSERDRSR